MSDNPIAVAILAAGKGTRMHSEKPKVLHEIGHKPMLSHVVDTAQTLKPEKIVTVIGPDMREVEQLLNGKSEVAIQKERLGTGHAFAQSLPALKDFDGTVIVLYGDVPLISEKTLRGLLAVHQSPEQPQITVLGMTPPDPFGFGRMILDDKGTLIDIIEQKDADEEQKQIPYCNSGIMAMKSAGLKALCDKLSNNNAQGEYYLVDLIRHAKAGGKICAHHPGNYAELMGVNDRLQLSQVESVFQSRQRIKFLEAGVTFQDPTTVYFAHDTQIDSDVVVEPNVFFGVGVQVEQSATIKAFSHLEGVCVGKGAKVGPFARLRPGSEIGEGAEVGNFAEINRASLAAKAKCKHVSYIGDTTIKSGANIGAGTIVCNYDGQNKHKTQIGEGAFIGSNSTLVAPVEIGESAYIAAGSVITEDVQAGKLAFGRARQTSKDKK